MEFELDEPDDSDVVSYEEDDDTLFDDIAALKESVDSLMNRVVNLAVKVEEVSQKLENHVIEADAHHVAMLAKRNKK